MFNLSPSGNLGYNGISQLSDVRCTPQYDGGVERPLSSPGGKLRAFLHSEAQAKAPTGDRPTVQTERSSIPRLQALGEDIYTFRDSEPVNNSNPRLRTPSGEKSDPIIVKKSDLIPPRSAVKQMNGISSIRSNLNTNLHNGVHDSDKSNANTFNKSPTQPARVTVRQNKDLFANYPASDLKKFPAEDRRTDSPEDCTKTSIISSLSVGGRDGSLYQDCKLNDAAMKREGAGWGAEGTVTVPLFNSLPKFSPSIPPRKLPSGKPPPASSRSRRGRGPAVHEALQRITPPPGAPPPVQILPAAQWRAPTTALFDCEPLDAVQCDDGINNCVQPWLEGVGGAEPSLGRAERLAARRAALRRRATQLCHYTSSAHSAYSLHNCVKQQQGRTRSESFRMEGPLLDRLLSSRGSTALLSAADRKKIRTGCKLLGGAGCSAPGCNVPSLACAAYCLSHIAASPDQRLFSRCTAKFSDNTQCRMPVVNVTSHLPLCTEHAWKRDNYNKISQELKPKKAPRKRPKPSAMIRPQKRNRKRKKPPPPEITHPPTLHTQGSTSSGCEESTEETGMGLSEEFIGAATTHHIDEEVVAQVLGLQEEETPAPSREAQIDLSTVFNDFFTAEQNEEYIPTREETEELERALEAVNQDVKSLEKLTATQGSALLLDALLDERALAETLASLPDVFSPSPNCTA